LRKECYGRQAEDKESSANQKEEVKTNPPEENEGQATKGGSRADETVGP
jgi:hypothetical protein